MSVHQSDHQSDRQADRQYRVNLSFGIKLDSRATTKYWTISYNSLKMLVSCLTSRSDNNQPKQVLIRCFELRDDLGHTKACHILPCFNSDVRSSFAYRSRKVCLCIYNNLFVFQIYLQANVSSVASLLPRKKVLQHLGHKFIYLAAKYKNSQFIQIFILCVLPGFHSFRHRFIKLF